MRGSISNFLIVIFLSYSVSNHAQPNTVAYSQEQETTSISQWEVIDIVFEGQSETPFDETFGANFTHDDGSALTIPGFYNGAGKWILRFSASDLGKWSYTTYASIPGVAGKTGVIQVMENETETQHGALILPDTLPNHFFYEDGTPYFLMAFECDWLFALDTDSPGLPKSRQLLSHLETFGFNQLVMNVYAHDVAWKKDPELPQKYEYGNPDIYPFGGTNDNPDFSTLNPEFFQHLDRVIHLLQEKNIVAHLMIYVWNKKVSWPDMYTEADNRFFDYVIKRYQAFPNILWDVSKEALTYGRCDMEYVSERIDRINRLDAYDRLITVHDYKYCKQYPEKVDIISIQSWKTDLHSQMENIRNTFPNKPIFNIEHGGYESCEYEVFQGDYSDAKTCLRRNYECAFAGVYSTYYWQGTSWNVIIHDPFADDVYQQPHFEYFSPFTKLFQHYPFHSLKPAALASSGLCLTNEDDLYLYFIPGENDAAHLQLPKSEYSQLKLTWMNLYSGLFTTSEIQEYQPWLTVTSPWKGEDSMIIVERVE